ncbi:MAG: hypothetical protein KAT15_17065, partial [Bacteroidales bacterium]|nr:hypothetical protein [Bacteroidales bacterium]
MPTELIKWYIILFVVSLVIYSVIEKKVKEAKTYRKRNLLYAVLGGLCFGIITLTAYLGLREASLYYFILIQVLLLITGILHSQLIYRILPWTSPGSFWWVFLFSLMIACIGTILMLLSFTTLKLTDHYFLMLSAIVWFFIPYYFNQAVSQYLLIPVMKMKEWFYPLDQRIEPPTDP